MGDSCARELIHRRLLPNVCRNCVSEGGSEVSAFCLPRPPITIPLLQTFGVLRY